MNLSSHSYVVGQLRCSSCFAIVREAARSDALRWDLLIPKILRDWQKLLPYHCIVVCRSLAFVAKLVHFSDVDPEGGQKFIMRDVV